MPHVSSGKPKSAHAPERRHAAVLRARLLPEHARLIKRAARHAGLTVSAWLRDRTLETARAELAASGA